MSSTGAQAVDLYVSTQGSDSNDGSSTSPLRTITKAYSLANPGTTIIVLPGVYTDYSSGWGIHLGKNGSVSSPIIIKSQIRGKAIVDGQFASDRNEGFYIDGTYNVVDGFEVRNSPKNGIALFGDNNRILNNDIHDNGNPTNTITAGLNGVYSEFGTLGNYYAGNSVHDNGRKGSNLDHGMYLCGQNESVINNLLFRNAATGLQIAGYTTVSNMKVYNNVIAWNGTSGIVLWMAIDGVDIKNNIMYSNGGYGLTSYDAHGGGVVVDQNLCFGNLLGPYNFTAGGSDYSYALGMTLTSDPLFVNGRSAGFDPHLTSNSPAANNAVNLYSIFTTDKNGAVRRATGTWDLGGYIYSNAPAAPVNSGTTLRLTLRNGNVELRWPLSSADYIVQSKPITNPGGAWQDVSVVPVLDQNENLVSLPISEPGRIFRLRNRSVSVVSAVALSMSVQNGNFQVRWPLDSGDYVLQSKSLTQPGSAWQDVSITPMQDQNQNMVSFTMADAGRIFRLRSGTVLFGL